MIHGHLHPDFWRTAKLFEKQVKAFPGGAALAVYHHGEKVVDLWAGVMDEKGTPWHEDTMAVSFSTTKGIASTALHVCADRGLIDYDAPVCRYWPEFAQQGKQDVTVRHVLTHQAGLFAIRRLIDNANHMLDWEHMVETLAGAKLQMKPGTGSAYHALTYGWLVGELVKRVSGKSITDFLQSEIAKPLKLDGLYIGVPKKELHRVSQLVDHMQSMKKVFKDGPPGQKHKNGTPLAHKLIGLWDRTRHPFNSLGAKGITHFDFSSHAAVSAAIPAANGVFTARSLAKLYAMIGNGGELGGVRILSKETIRKMSQVEHRGIDRVIPFDMQFRLGYHGAFTLRGPLPHGFGHYGFGGSGGFADLDRNVSMGLIVNGGVGSKLLGDLRPVLFAGAIVESVDKGKGSSGRKYGSVRQGKAA